MIRAGPQRRVVLDGGGERRAIHARQAHVGEHEPARLALGGGRLEGSERFVAVGVGEDFHAPGAELFAQDLARAARTGDERADPGEIGRRRGAVFLVLEQDRLLGQQDREPECGPLSRRAFDADLAAHEFDELLGDGQTEAGAAEFARHRPVGLHEGLEQPARCLLAQTDARVGDLHANLRDPWAFLEVWRRGRAPCPWA